MQSLIQFMICKVVLSIHKKRSLKVLPQHQNSDETRDFFVACSSVRACLRRNYANLFYHLKKTKKSGKVKPCNTFKKNSLFINQLKTTTQATSVIKRDSNSLFYVSTKIHKKLATLFCVYACEIRTTLLCTFALRLN